MLAAVQVFKWESLTMATAYYTRIAHTMNVAIFRATTHYSRDISLTLLLLETDDPTDLHHRCITRVLVKNRHNKKR